MINAFSTKDLTDKFHWMYKLELFFKRVIFNLLFIKWFEIVFDDEADYSSRNKTCNGVQKLYHAVSNH